MALRQHHRGIAPNPNSSTNSGFPCPHCGISLKTDRGCEQHVTLTPFCWARHEYQTKRKREQESRTSVPALETEPPGKRTRIDEDSPPVAGPSRLPIPDPTSSHSATEGAVPGSADGYTAGGVFVEPFPVNTAGAPIGTGQRSEEDLREYLQSSGQLGDRDLFETAEILLTMGLSGRNRTRHLKGPMYKWKGKEKEVWSDNAELLRDIDKLPAGAEWSTANITVGKSRDKRTHTLYLWDILEVIRQLLGAQRFKRWMWYAPERHWTSKDKTHRVHDETWSRDWWWRMQYLIGNKQGTVVPLIVASDQTSLANNPRSPQGHPIYLSLGNINKVIRRRPTKRAMVLIGYLPVDSFSDIANEDTRKQYHAELYHCSVEKIFEPLKTASSEGMLAWCADSCLRHIYPIIAAWSADWGEQNSVACTTQTGCPKCTQRWKG
ncbi:hypothetical protein FRC10_011980 [Ceratobasidium sp. 414]|nr:hypothetical protein FRC10_011980 [Ceratobasidium sp. 414]